MLGQLEIIPLETNNIIVYVQSELLKSVVKDVLKERFGSQRNTHKIARTAAELKDVKHNTMVEPFGGGLWFVEVETEDIKMKELIEGLKNTYNSAVTIYWVNNYGMYKRLTELDIVHRQGVFTQQYYLGRLEDVDVPYIQSHILRKDETRYLPKNIMTYLKKNYRYDVDSVCTLFLKVRDGLKVKTRKDVIDAVGLGGNTVDNFVIKLLTANPVTDKGLDNTIKESLILLNDLHTKHEYTTIMWYMQSAVETVKEIKELQLTGRFTTVIQEIPEGYNEYKIKRLRRFHWVILEKITMARVLNLKLCLQEVGIFETEVDIIRAVMIYLTGVKHSLEKHPEKQKELQQWYKR